MQILITLRNTNHLLAIDSLIRNGCQVDIILIEDNYKFYEFEKLVGKYSNVYITKSLDILFELCNKKKYDYIFPSFSDWGSTTTIASVNEKFNISGIRPVTYNQISSKNDYYKIWDDLEIPYPKLYAVVPAFQNLERIPENVEFPCILKPSVGSSSVGIQIVEDEKSLINFFADSDTQSHDYQEQYNNKFKNIQYLCSGHSYLIQKFIKGDIVSFIGHVYNNNITVDLIFDIESTAFPFVSETALSWPSKFNEADLLKSSIKYLEQFFQKINFDNGAFMLDVIVDKHGLVHFIDFSPRLSVSHPLMWHGGEKDYGYKLIKKLVTGENFNCEIKKKCVIFRALSFENKEIAEIVVGRKDLSDSFKLPESKIHQLRNDLAVYNNGYAIFTGNSKFEAEKKHNMFIENLQISYKN
jgi:biotin carboxylase